MKKLWLFGAVAVAMSSCAVNEIDKDNINVEEASPVFYTDLSDDPVTKTYVDPDLNLRWTADDRISIFTNTYNQEYKFKGKTGNNSGSFKKVPGDDFVTGNSIDRNYAVYPYNEDTELLESGEMTIILPAVQAYAENTFGLGANTMVAVTSSTSDMFLPFKNLCGYLVLKLYGDATIASVSVKGNNGEKISGTSTLTPEYGEAPIVTVSEDGGDCITLDCGDGITIGATKETATAFWIVVPPVTFSKGFTITVTDDEGATMTKSTSASKTLQRNVKNSMAAFKAVFEEETVPVESVNVSPSTVNLKVAETAELTASVFPVNATDKTVVWSSSDESVATVSEGVVTAVKIGTCTVTAKSGDKTATCTVTVDKTAVTAVSLNKTELTLKAGGTATLTATVYPENATYKDVTWSSDHSDIVSVENGLITAIKPGTAVIKAEADGEFAQCIVVVEATSVESVSLDKTSLNLKVGESKTLIPTVNPDDATDKSVTWSSSDSEIAIVTDGKVSAIKEGTATITVKTTDGGKTATCVVTVQNRDGGTNEDVIFEDWKI